MIEFRGRGILLDIEGTTSSIRFVYDEMFPFVLRELDGFLKTNWGSAEVHDACETIARDAGFDSLDQWQSEDDQKRSPEQLVHDEVLRLMTGDVKATGLKQLQGLIWRAGFESGELRAHVYDDVPPALRRWCDAGRDVRIYSSGSIAAQHLFFGHTMAGDLRQCFRGHYDTTTGPKKESTSYQTIAHEFSLPPAEILFLSDVPAELDAARLAGLQTALCRRPGNAAVPPDHGHPEISKFDEIV